MSLLLALLLDAALGEPRWLWQRLPHPAVLLGRAVGWADRHLNRGGNRRAKGTLAMAGLAGLALLTGTVLQALAGIWAEVIVGAILLAQRSLVQHLQAVGDGLRLSLGDGRRAVAMIVSRDTLTLDRSGVARSAIESGAENLSDGVVAPAFWFALLGLPGLLIYKTTNTADSMIGYMTPRHAEFGWAAARLDDLLNWVPARLTAAAIWVLCGRPDWRDIRRDARRHRSPNAGWPEAAMARALDVALAGPRSYNGKMTEFPFVHPAGRRTIGADDIDSAVGILWRVWWLGLACVGAGLILA